MPLEEKDYMYKEYYATNIRLFKIIGVLQYQTSIKELMYTCSVNIIITIALLGQIFILINSELKITSIVKLLETTLPTVCFGFCYYNLLLNSTIMKKILYHIKCDWNELQDKPELIILKNYEDISRQCSIIIAFIFYLYIATLICPSLLLIFQYIFGIISVTELKLPVNVDFVMNNQILYYITLLYEYVGLILISMVGIAHYTMFITIIQHACALYNIISVRIDERFKINNHKFDNSNIHTKSVDENKWIIDIIEFYNNLVNFIHLIKSCYEKLFLLEIALASLLIILDYYYFFEVLFLSLNMSEELTKLSYIIGSLSVIFAYNSLGQKLIDKHSEVFIKLCQIPYYSLSLKTQKLLLFLIMRSMKPCNLSVKGVIVISHRLFAALMRTSFSYAMVFYNLQ